MEVTYQKYFAYGSNMSLTALDEMGVLYRNVRPAVLNGWELIFNVPESKFPGFAYANVVEKKGSVVKGLLMELESDSIAFLDEYEVFPLDYLKRNVQVELGDQSAQSAFIYVANPLVASVPQMPIPEHWAIIDHAYFEMNKI